MKTFALAALAVLAAPALAARASEGAKRDGATAAVYAQCGGNNFAGPTTCATGSVCIAQNEWYSQCVPSSQATSTAAAVATSSAAPAPAPSSSSSAAQVPASSHVAASQVLAPVATSVKTSVTAKAATTASSTKAAGTTAAQGSAPSSISGYTSKSGIYPLGKSVSAIATTYGGDWTGGTCSFSDYPNAGINGVALGAQQWFGATGCGACVNITGATGSVIAMVNNQCPECVDNHLDLEAGYAARVDKDYATKGIFNISWDFVPCTGVVSGNLEFKNKDGAGPYYFAMQVRNSVLPVDTLEVSTNGGASWTMVTDREYYNFFTYTSGFGTDTVDVRVTSVTGQQVVQKGVKIGSGTIVAGSSQFSA